MESVFDVLTAAGVPRGDLVEAWAFHTGTGASFRGDLLAMREDALARIGDRGTSCTVTDVREDRTDAVFRRLEGTLEIPLYLDSEAPGARLVRDAAGVPVFQRMGTTRFVAIVPASVRDAGAPAPLLTVGHGLLGEAPDIALLAGEEGVRVRSRLGPLIDRLGMVAVATDWWGLSLEDGLTITNQLGELSRFPEVPERLMQAMINFLALTRTFAGVCADLPELAVGGAPTVDPTRQRYLGISGGGVLGFTLAALSPDIDRFVLIVGGASWPTLISRSFAFFPFNLVLNSAYADKRERDVMLAATALLWDQMDPISFAPLVLRAPLPDTPDRRVLLPAGRHDALVANVASDMGARAMGLPLLAPTSYAPHGVDLVEAPTDSAYAMYDLGAEPQPRGATQPTDNGVHEDVVRLEAVQRQIVAFLAGDGSVESFCDGVCDPE
jgi:hypothetical protein